MKTYAEKGYLPLLFLIGCAFWIAGHWRFLTGEYIFGHDSFFWHGTFQYLTESLWSGFLPLWNPYLHGGEIFFDKTGYIDPIALSGIIIGKLFAVNDTFYLYELITFARLIALAFGVQLLLNKLIPETREYSFFTFFVVLLSSFSINSYHQSGTYLVFGYTPFIMLFFLRFIEKPNWLNTLMMGYFTGISFQSLFFSYVATFLLLFIAVYLFYDKGGIKVLRANKIKLSCAFILFVLLSSPAWSLIFYKSSLFPYARTVFSPRQEPHFFIPSLDYFRGSNAPTGDWGDIVSLGILTFARKVYQDEMALPGGLRMTEMNMYIGLVPFVLGIIGIAWGKHRFKRLFLIMLLLSLALFLGPKTYNVAYSLLFYLVPSLRGLENTNEFANYFLLCYFFFVSLGMTVLLTRLRQINSGAKAVILATLFVVTMVELNTYVKSIYGLPGPRFAMLRRNSIQMDFSPNLTFGISSRIKSVLPASTSEYADLRLRHFYFFRKTDPTYMLNFAALFLRQSSATDFPLDFPYQYMNFFPPTALTYPKLYTDILKADISPRSKELLLGIEMPVFDFYPHYKLMQPDRLLKGEDSPEVSSLLSNTVVLPNELRLPLYTPDLNRVGGIHISVMKHLPHSVRVAVRTERDGVLLFRDGFDSSWKASIDGREVKVLRANYNDKAIAVDKGDHIIDFVFQPILYLASFGTYLTVTAFIIVFLLMSSFFHLAAVPHRRISN